MSYLNTYRAYVSDETRGRVAMASLQVANDVLYEDPKVEFHQTRFNMAEAVARDPLAYVQEFLLECLRNPTIYNSIDEQGVIGEPDSSLEQIILAAWNTIAQRLRFN